MTKLNKPKVELINSYPFNTDKVHLVFELLLPDTQPFDLALYIRVWLKSYDLFQKDLLSLKELIQIGSKLQTRKLPKELSLGAFTFKPFFDLLEYSSEVIYKYSTDSESVDWEIVAERVTQYAVELSSFKA